MKQETFYASAAILFALAAAANPAQAQPSNVTPYGAVLWDSCGGEDEPACLPGRPGFNVIPSTMPTKCDLTLDLNYEGNVWMCRDKGRRRTIPDLAYTQSTSPISASTFFQQSDQLGRISADLPLNYVPIIGTHNSYSNYKDGGSNPLNVDQVHTITDQLQLGARHIRLDPIGKASNGTPILCHISPLDEGLSKFLKLLGLPSDEQEFCAAGLFGKPLSFQRPFFYAVRELNKWLERHPGEVVILRINYVGSSVVKQDIAGVIVHELGDKLVQVPAEGRVPTLREMRGSGKQVIAIASNESRSEYVFTDPATLRNNWSNSTTNAYYPICVSQTGNQVGLLRDFKKFDEAIWPNIGEDRGGAMAYESDVNRGLLGAVETEIGVQCGYTFLGFDFFHSLPYAAKGHLPYVPSFDFTGPSPDPRPQAAIWSWRAGTMLTAPMPAALSKPSVTILAYPASLTDYRNIRWEPVAEQTALPFACAVAAEAANPRRYQWKITKTTGPWAAGETECQKLGSMYHFWRPMSSIENQELMTDLKAHPTQRVWLNHYSGKTTALPATVNLTYSPTASGGATVIMGSGIGGGFKLSFHPEGGAPNFLNVLESTALPRVELSPNPSVAATLTPGVYRGTLVIEETAGNLRGSTQVLVSMRVN